MFVFENKNLLSLEYTLEVYLFRIHFRILLRGCSTNKPCGNVQRVGAEAEILNLVVEM